ncbi:hypothetical protein ANN_06860 [Periplaneta americana]|uniref:Ionotropic glutamate receptor L-glutamate and glycine-binding domain-containing protein n=1 Tax=Periplaneta americana TaxID=6978 RepID=A0ABQ8TEN1_PERAM|nr:hypothetical protein ANN_06860 [Periplaneta americana]
MFLTVPKKINPKYCSQEIVLAMPQNRISQSIAKRRADWLYHVPPKRNELGNHPAEATLLLSCCQWYVLQKLVEDVLQKVSIHDTIQSTFKEIRSNHSVSEDATPDIDTPSMLVVHFSQPERIDLRLVVTIMDIDIAISLGYCTTIRDDIKQRIRETCRPFDHAEVLRVTDSVRRRVRSDNRWAILTEPLIERDPISDPIRTRVACAEQSDGITVFRIPPMTSLMLHRCRTGAINLQRWWQSPSAAISESDSTEISQNFASVAQTTTYTVAITAIDSSSSFVPISLQRDVIVVHRSGLTSCDVERSFSQYKSLFRENRHAFVMENLEMTFVVHCNSRPSSSTQVRNGDDERSRVFRSSVIGWDDYITNNLPQIVQSKWSVLVYGSEHPVAVNMTNSHIGTGDMWQMNEHGGFLETHTLFPPKIPNDLLQCPFTASVYSNIPYVEITTQSVIDPGTAKKRYSGLEIKLLRAIAHGMNATLVFQDTPPRTDNMWGHRLKNGTITGIIGDVLYGKSDIALSAMPKGFDLLEAILDSTISYIDSVLLWYVQCAKHQERWDSVTRMFSVLVWVMFCISYVLVTLATRRAAINSKILQLNESKLYSNIFEIAYIIFGIIVGSTVAALPRSTRVRFIIMVWLWYSLAFNVIFQTLYTSFLVDPGYLKQIRNVDELLATKLHLTYVSELDYLYRDSSDIREQKILARRTYCMDITLCLDRAAITGDTATIANNLDIHYRSNNTRLLCRLDDDILKFNLAMFMAKGSPLLIRVDKIILRLIEAGLLHQWLKEHKEQLERDGRHKGSAYDEDDDGYFVFAVQHLSIVFGCLITGHILSFVAFMGEIIHHKMMTFCPCHRKQKRRNKQSIVFMRVNKRVHRFQY